MATLADEETTKKALLQWASDKLLKEASLSENGESLTLRETTLAAGDQVTVEHGGKSCRYSLASIYLQIIDPDQGLLAYRNVCKKFNVSDPVKPLDKPTVVGYFLRSAGPSGSSSAPAAAAVSAHPEEDSARKEKKRKEKREHRAKKDSKKRSSKDHSHRREEKSPKRKKKEKSLVTNETLFSNLSVVVDKRQLEQETKEEITKALSADGFQVTPELLEEYKETTQTILANEIPVGNSASILRAANPRKNLSRVLDLYLETVTPPSSSKGGKHSKSVNSNRTSSGGAMMKQPKKHLIGKKPVIVVPKGMTAPITLINAHEFLSNGRFVPRDVLIKQGRQRSPSTTFTRNVRGVSGAAGLLEYEIIDNPKKLGNDPKEWERIVAVIALGQSWQFKDWPKPYNNPVHLFNSTYGFFVSMEGDKLPNDIQAWAVTQARLNRDKRGLDSVTHASFWNGLDEWMKVHKRELLPQPEA